MGRVYRYLIAIKANYFKMGIRNFLFTKRDGFDATGIMLEYA